MTNIILMVGGFLGLLVAILGKIVLSMAGDNAKLKAEQKAAKTVTDVRAKTHATSDEELDKEVDKWTRKS